MISFILALSAHHEFILSVILTMKVGGTTADLTKAIGCFCAGAGIYAIITVLKFNNHQIIMS